MERYSAEELNVARELSLLFPVLFLVGIGIVMVYSASSALALKDFNSDYYFLKKQAFFAFIGILTLAACRNLPLSLIRSMAYPMLGISFLLLILIHLPGCGICAGGATRWLKVGSFSFQPSELSRLAMINYLAYSMSKKGEKLQRFSVGFLPHMIVLAAFSGLIMLQPDFGSVVILGAITWILLFVGGVRFTHLAGALAVAAPLAWIFLVNEAYRLERLISFRDPWQYATDGGYQIIHSLMAFGTGGIWGTGLGKGYQKLFYLPEPHTDFIFSVIGEELGLLGVLTILAFYFLIIRKGITIALSQEDDYLSFLAIGLTVSLALQVFVNMGVTLALLPPKGLTLPFLSYGGTSLVLNMAAIGVLMNIGAARA